MSRQEAWRSMAMVLGYWHLRGYGFWAVEERASGELVGRVGCWEPEGWPSLEVGWTLRRAYWGRGYATEAARAALEYAFETLDQTHVISLIDPNNTNSIRVAERLGERPEGGWDVFGNKAVIHGIDRGLGVVAREVFEDDAAAQEDFVDAVGSLRAAAAGHQFRAKDDAHAG